MTQHHYHDHASDPVVNYGPASPGKRHPSPSNNNSLATPFPTKLYEMIEKVETQGLSHVVSWQPHGRCFKVHDMPTFKLLLQNYFKLSKIASFQRQLNLYGFQRLTVGLDKGSYYHELFIRSRPDLVSRIERVKVKGTGVRAKANPDDEPNLYSYPAVDNVADVAVITANSSYSITEQQEPPTLTSAILTPDEVVDTTAPTLGDISDIASNTRDYSNDYIEMYNEVRVSAVSCDNSEAPCAIMNGLLRNLSSLNVFPTNGNESLKTLLRSTNTRNATFPSPNLLRNVSSCVLSNNISFASVFPQNTTQDESPIVQDQRTNMQRRLFMDTDGIHRNATIAVEQLRTISEAEDDVSFDKLIDEMFEQNQTLDFSDLVKLASDVDNKSSSGDAMRRRNTA
jgi:HSF-type DNA-binding